MIGIHMSGVADAILGFIYACGMLILGARLCYMVGRMLLMSYYGIGVQELLADLQADRDVTSVDEAKVWQVHSGLCMANFKIHIRSAEQIDSLRDRISSLVKQRLRQELGDSKKQMRWEISSQMTVD